MLLLIKAKRLICFIIKLTVVADQSKLDQYKGFQIQENENKIKENSRLFLPLNQTWYELFANGQKEWEIRGISDNFNQKTVKLGRTVEIRKGYQSDPLWGIIKEKLVVDSIEKIPKTIYDKTVPPSVQEKPEVIDFIMKYNDKYKKFILFKIQIEKLKNKEMSAIILPHPLKKELPDNLNINDPFFDYFKDKYPFEEWLRKCSLDRRECWVYYEDNTNIGALLIPKIEDGSINDSVPRLPKKKRLKICTFKVKSTGNRIGELFIKCATRLALEKNASEIYLTHFTEENDRLIALISEYGFEKVATIERENGTEDLYLKNMRIEGQNIGGLHPVEIAKKFYPCFDDRETIKKFIIPIRPEYHNRLFNDYDSNPLTAKEDHQKRLQEYVEGGMDILPIIEGNTIKKAYLCHSNSKKIRNGDIILFYRSKDLKSITALGVIESIKVGLTDFEEIYSLVRKRTACSKESIKKIAEKPTTVILFTHQTYFSKGLDIKYLNSIGITSPMSINEIDHEKYIKIKEYGKLDGRLTID